MLLKPLKRLALILFIVSSALSNYTNAQSSCTTFPAAETLGTRTGGNFWANCVSWINLPSTNCDENGKVKADVMGQYYHNVSSQMNVQSTTPESQLSTKGINLGSNVTMDIFAPFTRANNPNVSCLNIHGYLYINKEVDFAVNDELEEGAVLTIYNGGQVIINSNGHLKVQKIIIKNGGKLIIRGGGIVSRKGSLSSPGLVIEQGGIVDVQNGGQLTYLGDNLSSCKTILKGSIDQNYNINSTNDANKIQLGVLSNEQTNLGELITSTGYLGQLYGSNHDFFGKDSYGNPTHVGGVVEFKGRTSTKRTIYFTSYNLLYNIRVTNAILYLNKNLSVGGSIILNEGGLLNTSSKWVEANSFSSLDDEAYVLGKIRVTVDGGSQRLVNLPFYENYSARTRSIVSCKIHNDESYPVTFYFEHKGGSHPTQLDSKYQRKTPDYLTISKSSSTANVYLSEFKRYLNSENFYNYKYGRVLRKGTNVNSWDELNSQFVRRETYFGNTFLKSYVEVNENITQFGDFSFCNLTCDQATSISYAVAPSSCPGTLSNDGEIDIKSVVGLPEGENPKYTYSYLWSNNATTSKISNLAQAVYKVTVTNNDNVACNDISFKNKWEKTISVGLKSNPAISIQNSSTHCKGEPFSLNVKMSGTITPNYSFKYSIDGVEQDPVPAFSTTEYSIPGLPLGTYQITEVSDANCTRTYSTSKTITEVDKPTTSFQFTNVCSATRLNLGNTYPYVITYTKDGVEQDLVTINEGEDYLFSGAGTYKVTKITDGNNCSTEYEAGTEPTSVILKKPTATISLRHPEKEGKLCPNATGVELVLDLEGTGPWVLDYKKDGGSIQKTLPIEENEDEEYYLELTEAGSYEFINVWDELCPSLNFSQTITIENQALPTASFKNATNCGYALLNLNGVGASTAKYTTVYNNNVSDGTIYFTNNSIGSINKPGISTLESVEDKYCENKFEGQQAPTGTVLPLPTANIGFENPNEDGVYCANEAAPRLKFVFGGNGPWRVNYQKDDEQAITTEPTSESTFYLELSETGAYKINWIKDANDCQKNINQTFNIEKKTSPAVLFTDTEKCFGEDLIISAEMNTAVGYSIDGGSIQNINISAGAPYTLSQPAVGTYKIETINADGCTEPYNASKHLAEVRKLPTVVLSGGGEYCSNEALPNIQLTFGGTSKYGFDYTFNGTADGESEIESKDYTTNFSADGNYTITKVYDKHCSADVNISANLLKHALPTAEFKKDKYCAGENAVFTLTGTGTISYSYNADGSGSGTAGDHYFTEVGDYTINTVSDQNCVNSSPTNNTTSIKPLPTAEIAGGGEFCRYETTPALEFTLGGTGDILLKYTTNNGMQKDVTGTKGLVLVNEAEEGTQKIVYLKDANCENTGIEQQNKTVELTGYDAPTATFISDKCMPNAVTIKLKGKGDWKVTYEKDGVSKTETATTSEYTFLRSGPGEYKITKIVDKFCENYEVVSKTIHAIPTAEIKGGGEYCAGSTIPQVTIELTGHPSWNFTYSNGTENKDESTTSSPFTLNETTDATYTLVSVSNDYCTGTVSGSATIKTLPLPTASFETTPVCEGTKLRLKRNSGSGDWKVKTNGTWGAEFTSGEYIEFSTVGNYSITDIVDANCSNILTNIEGSIVPNPSFDKVVVTPSYCGDPTANTEIVVSSGKAPYSYANNGNNLSVVDNQTELKVGSNALVVTDQNGCSNNKTVTVTEKSDFTIGGSDADFNTISEATAFLNNVKENEPITCALTFSIRNGEYFDNLELEKIPGSGVANRITFKSESGDASQVKIIKSDNSTPNFIRLEETDGIIFQNITFTDNSTNTNNNFVVSDNIGSSSDDANHPERRVDGFQLKNCVLNNINLSVSNGAIQQRTLIDGEYVLHNAAIQITGNELNQSSIGVNNANNVVITNNNINNTLSTNGYGIKVFNAWDYTITNNKVITNTPSAVVLAPFKRAQNDNSTEWGNKFENNLVVASKNDAKGIHIQQLYDDSKINVRHNTVHMSSNSSNSSYALYVQNSGFTGSQNSMLLNNNLFHQTGTGKIYYFDNLNTSSKASLKNFGYNSNPSNNVYATVANMGGDLNLSDGSFLRTELLYEDPKKKAGDYFKLEAGTPVVFKAEFLSDVTKDFFGEDRNPLGTTFGAWEADVFYMPTVPSLCSSNEAFVLEGGFPLGGTYSGPGVQADGKTFDPYEAYDKTTRGNQTVTITYTVKGESMDGTIRLEESIIPDVYIRTYKDHHCIGDNVTLSAMTHGGIKWDDEVKFYVNNVYVPKQHPQTINFENLNDGDKIYCEFIPRQGCIDRVKNSDKSDIYTAQFFDYLNPSFGFERVNGEIFCENHESFDIKLNIKDGGANPTVLWPKPQGLEITDLGNYTYNIKPTQLGPNQKYVHVEATLSVSENHCMPSDSYTGKKGFNKYTFVWIENDIKPIVKINVDHNETCERKGMIFSVDESSLYGEGTNPTFVWNLNGKDLPNETGKTLVRDLVEGDVVYVKLHSNIECLAEGYQEVPSNSITITEKLVPGAFDYGGGRLPKVVMCDNPDKNDYMEVGMRYYGTGSAHGIIERYYFSVDSVEDEFNYGHIYRLYPEKESTKISVRAKVKDDKVCFDRNIMIPELEVKFLPKLNVQSNFIVENEPQCSGEDFKLTFNATGVGNETTWKWSNNLTTDVEENTNTYTIPKELIGNNNFSASLEVVLSEDEARCAVGNQKPIHTENIEAKRYQPAVSISIDNDKTYERENMIFTVIEDQLKDQGTTPTFIWNLNGNDLPNEIGKTLKGSFKENDIILVKMKSSVPCVEEGYEEVKSNSITITEKIIVEFPEQVCTSDDPFQLSDAIPSSGTYSGPGVQADGKTFNPAEAYDESIGGTQTIELSYTVNGVSVEGNVLLLEALKPSAFVEKKKSNFCVGDVLSVVCATSNQAGPTDFQWYHKGKEIPNERNRDLKTSNVKNGDEIYCVYKPTVGCIAKSHQTITTDPLTVEFHDYPNPTISFERINGDIFCKNDESFDIKVNINNGGANPSVRWYASHESVITNIGENSVNIKPVVTDGRHNYIHVEAFVSVEEENHCMPSDEISKYVFVWKEENIEPTVQIVVDHNQTCERKGMVFSVDESTIYGGGKNPTFIWNVNGKDLLTETEKSLIRDVNKGDIVTVKMKSSLACIAPGFEEVSSNLITVTEKKTVGDITYGNSWKTVICDLPDNEESVTLNLVHNGKAVTTTDKGIFEKFDWYVDGKIHSSNHEPSFTYVPSKRITEISAKVKVSEDEICIEDKDATVDPFTVKFMKRFSMWASIGPKEEGPYCENQEIVYENKTNEISDETRWQWSTKYGTPGPVTNSKTFTISADKAKFSSPIVQIRLIPGPDESQCFDGGRMEAEAHVSLTPSIYSIGYPIKGKGGAFESFEELLTEIKENTSNTCPATVIMNKSTDGEKVSIKNVNRQITFKEVEGKEIQIKGGFSGGSVVEIINSYKTKFEGIDIINTEKGGKAVYASKSPSLEIRKAKVIGHASAIETNECNNLTISRSFLTSTGAGFKDNNSGNIRLVNNIVSVSSSYGSTGLYLSGSSGEIKNNTVLESGNYTGSALYAKYTDIDVTNNILVNHGGGQALKATGNFKGYLNHNIYYSPTFLPEEYRDAVLIDYLGKQYDNMADWQSAESFDSNSKKFNYSSVIYNTVGGPNFDFARTSDDLLGATGPSLSIDYFAIARDEAYKTIGAVQYTKPNQSPPPPLKIAASCNDDDCKIQEEDTLPACAYPASFSGPTGICQGQTIGFWSTSDWRYTSLTWYLDGVQIGTGANISVPIVNNKHVLRLEASTGDSCLTIVEKELDIKAKVGDIVGPAVACQGYAASFYVDGDDAGTYTWHTGGLPFTQSVDGKSIVIDNFNWNATIEAHHSNGTCWSGKAVSVVADGTCFEDRFAKKGSLEEDAVEVSNTPTKLEVKSYPNPTSNKLNVELSVSGTTRIEVLDVNGKKMLEKVINDYSAVLDVSELTSGLYTLRVSQKQETVITKIQVIK